MESSILIAKILGPLYVVSAFGWLFNRKIYGDIVEEYLNHRGLLYLSAILAFLFGATILTFHNVWIADWPMIITMLAMIGLIKGLSILVYPDKTISLALAFASNMSAMFVTFFLIFALGAALTWFGYFA